MAVFEILAKGFSTFLSTYGYSIQSLHLVTLEEKLIMNLCLE